MSKTTLLRRLKALGIHERRNASRSMSKTLGKYTTDWMGLRVGLRRAGGSNRSLEKTSIAAKELVKSYCAAEHSRLLKHSSLQGLGKSLKEKPSLEDRWEIFSAGSMFFENLG